MGYALAEAAKNAGANVTLVSGPVILPEPKNMHCIKVEKAKEMHHAIISRANTHDVYIGAAAVADYSPTTISKSKIKKQHNDSVIQMQKTKDILADVASLDNRPSFVVGFAAETDDLEHYAKDKLKRKNLDMIAANWVGKPQGGFESDKNALQVYWSGGSKTLKMTDKKQLAEQLISLIAERMDEKNTA
jgi:phosphopantothenoylcysteine decarboxylase/phosphopantothenate--cysteine ligase